MSKYFNFKRFALFFSVIFLISSCENDDSKKNDNAPDANTNTAATTNTATTKNALLNAALTAGPLDTLWTDSASFVKLPNAKMVFIFTFRQNDTLTLHGWHAKGLLGNSFDSLPDIMLIKGHASTINYGPDMYFGNVILKDVNEIQKKLKSEKAQYVLFAPKIVDGNHIGYRILLSKESPALVKVLAVIDTGIDANPSPPKIN